MDIKKEYDSFRKKLSFLKWLDPFTYIEILLRKFHPEKENPSNTDKLIDNVVYIVSALILAFLLYTLLGLLLNTSSPMVIVSSSSMVPEMYRGDIIVLYGEKNLKAKEVNFDGSISDKMYLEYGKTFPDPVEKFIDTSTGQIIVKLNTAEEIQIGEEKFPVTKDGDTIVYFSQYSQKDIIHRAVAKINATDGVFFLTKGAANPSLDQECVKETTATGQTVYLACISKKAVSEEEVKGKAVFRIPLVGCIKIWVFDNIPAFFATGKLPSDFYGVC